MSAEYNWSSPGGIYKVPDDFKRRFLSEFPGYRIRWSLRLGNWQIEQPTGARGALPPTRIDDAAHDDLIRSKDGFWLVMQTAPGDRISCPSLVDRLTKQLCGWTLQIKRRWAGELKCPVCVKAGRDGRTITGYWPFDETLIEHLRSTNPLGRGFVRVNGKTRTRASVQVDANNARLQKEAAQKQSDAVTSIDAVDHRWMTGIASSTGLTRRTIDTKDLE